MNLIPHQGSAIAATADRPIDFAMPTDLSDFLRFQRSGSSGRREGITAGDGRLAKSYCVGGVGVTLPGAQPSRNSRTGDTGHRCLEGPSHI